MPQILAYASGFFLFLFGAAAYGQSFVITNSDGSRRYSFENTDGAAIDELLTLFGDIRFTFESIPADWAIEYRFVFARFLIRYKSDEAVGSEMRETDEYEDPSSPKIGASWTRISNPWTVATEDFYPPDDISSALRLGNAGTMQLAKAVVLQFRFVSADGQIRQKLSLPARYPRVN